MALELHIWGPAFGLPSIDAKCFAAIVLLQNSLPDTPWTLVPDFNPNSNPFTELPALRHGKLWIAGFRNIARYLSSEVVQTRNLDDDLTDLQLADREAFFSFLEARGQPLLDLSLYVSSDNYTMKTRSALAEILEWPHSWTIPHQLRDKAKKRSEHLGLSGLDVDAVREKQLKGEEEGLTAHIPKSLRKPKLTVSSLLGSSAQQTRFRVEGVSADFFEPLEERIAKQNGLLKNGITTVDCLALGILALMSLSDLPQPWLNELLRMKYPKLQEWTAKIISETFGSAVTPSAVFNRHVASSSKLPWQQPAQRSWPRFAADVLDATIGSIPLVGVGPNLTILESSNTTGLNKYERKQLIRIRQRRQHLLRQEIVATCLSSLTLVGWLVYAGVLPLPKRSPGPMRQEFGIVRRSFGEAGSFLGLG